VDRDDQAPERATTSGDGLGLIGRRRGPRPAGVAVAVAVTALVLLTALARSSASHLLPGAAGTPCADLTGIVGTPGPEGGATPPATVEGAACLDAESFGTPVAADGLTVTLLADNFKAGPRQLTVVIVDADGQPMVDATVTIRTRSLEMEHGVAITETVQTEPGHYFAEHVSLGMGGDWLAEVTIERPGAEPVILYFVLTLEGPM
jgi:hypothetical protein